MKNNKHLTSSIKPGDQYAAPLRIVLHESHSSTPERPEYVVHTQNMQDGGFFFGGYHNARSWERMGRATDQANACAYCEALAEYAQRCLELGVDPIPSEAVQAIPAGMPRPMRGLGMTEEIERMMSL